MIVFDILCRCRVVIAYVVALGVGLMGCTSPESTQPAGRSPALTQAPESFDLTTARVVDLTYSYDRDTIYWPDAPTTFELTQIAFGPTDAGYFYAANSFSTPEHGGTHLDAPIHFAEAGWTSDEIPVEQLIGPAVVIDISEQAAEDVDYRLSSEDIRAWEGRHGVIPEGAIVLLRTGWGSRWPERNSYLGDDTPGDTTNLHFPSYGAEAATYLVEERRVRVLGVDTASIDYGQSQHFVVHQIAHTVNVSGLENVANLDQLPETGAWVIALPMKIAGGTGGPTRIIGLIWD